MTSDPPTMTSDIEVIDALEPATLRERIEGGEALSILDVRTRADFEQWHLEGESVTIENRPYYEFIEGEGVPDDLPAGDSLIVVCAEGDASAYVAEQLQDAGRAAVTLAGGMNAWAELYDRTPIAAYDGPGELYQYYRPATGCLSYLLVSGGEAAVFDPLLAFEDRYRTDVGQKQLKYAIDTHCHADHVSGVRRLADRGATGVVPKATVDRGMETWTEMVQVGEGTRLTVGEATIEVVPLPGHTSGMTGYLLDGAVLLSGDSVFAGSVARPDLEAGDDGAPEAAEQLYESLQKQVLSLSSSVLVAGGHAAAGEQPAEDGTYTATVGDLKDRIPALSMDRDGFLEHVLADMPPRPANFEEIIAANLGTQAVTEAEAFRIELGPNNCAASAGQSVG